MRCYDSGMYSEIKRQRAQLSSENYRPEKNRSSWSSVIFHFAGVFQLVPYLCTIGMY